ncbi:MAG: hypothetical protein ACREBU_20825, partial [Nitrososphaera sp.]
MGSLKGNSRMFQQLRNIFGRYHVAGVFSMCVGRIRSRNTLVVATLRSAPLGSAALWLTTEVVTTSSLRFRDVLIIVACRNGANEKAAGMTSRRPISGNTAGCARRVFCRDAPRRVSTSNHIENQGRRRRAIAWP